jgi:glutathione S-transferase
MIQLFSANVCPFAQRTRALLRYLDVPFERHEVDLRNKPEAFTSISPTGKVPLMVDGDTLLYESQVINEYLAEEYGWAQAFPAELAARARIRLAMKQFDSIVIDAFYASTFEWGKTKQPGLVKNADKVAAELGVLEKAWIELIDTEPTLLTFHVGPFWQRMDALRELSSFAETLVDVRPELRKRMDAAASFPVMRDTSLPAEELLANYRRYAERRAAE